MRMIRCIRRRCMLWSLFVVICVGFATVARPQIEGDEAARTVSSSVSSMPPLEWTKSPRPPRADARVEGGPQQGATVLLRGEHSDGEGLRFRWLQTLGRKIRLSNSDGATASFVMPDDSEVLGFLLIVTSPSGSDTAEVRVGGPVPAAAAPSNTRLRADAGDDQIALVGRQVTLNGGRSEPTGEIGCRWVQTGGPTTHLKLEDGAIFAFTPTVPGVYRFALLVAAGSEISTPDEVIVTVGGGTRIGGPAGVVSPGDAIVPDPTPTHEVARSALASLRGGPEAAEPLASLFEAAADRMDLYSSYADAFSEMSRRLEEILPADAAHHAIWIERLFNPLSAQTVEVMRIEGLDLRLPDARAASMSTAQKAALAEHFRLIAEGFRSSNRPR